MFYKTPQYTDDLLMLGAKRQGGPAVVDPSQLAAAHAANQARNQAYVENQRNTLGLGSAKLAEDQRQFDTRLGLRRSEMDYGRRAGDTASLLALGGLGVSTLGDIAANKRMQERMKIRNDMINQLNKAGDQKSMFFANILKYLE